MRLNQAGQGSSVFQLLIAAVVALAILGVLLQVLNLVNPEVGAEPSKAATDTLKSAYSSPSTLKSSQKVTFKPDTPPLNIRGIANSSGVISSDRLCLSLGDFDETKFENAGGQGATLRYIGSGAQTAKMDVLCDYGTTELTKTLESYNLPNANDWVGSCPSEFTSGTTQDTICVIALRIAR
ncbi:MAG: hypothetical protein Q7R47_05830 [Candidatus Diapherotrites archaeon]|nr:hypothetical protein [Candidatus Diapherotrites archaeon]